jgi:hypothetical protein
MQEANTRSLVLWPLLIARVLVENLQEEENFGMWKVQQAHTFRGIPVD